MAQHMSALLLRNNYAPDMVLTIFPSDYKSAENAVRRQILEWFGDNEEEIKYRMFGNKAPNNWKEKYFNTEFLMDYLDCFELMIQNDIPMIT